MFPAFVRDMLQICNMVAYTKVLIGKPLESEFLTQLHTPPDVFIRWIVTMWAGYCGIPIKEIKERKSFELAHLVTTYTLKFDTIVDTPEGRIAFVSNLQATKKQPELCVLAQAIAKWIVTVPLSKEQKFELVHIIQQFRYIALFSAYKRQVELQMQGGANINDALSVVEEINGLWGITLGRVFSIIHNVPSGVAERSERMFYHFLVAGQLYDDPFDYQSDIQSGDPNLVSAVLKEYPDEFTRVSAFFLTDKSRWGWLPLIAPKTCTRIQGLFLQQINLLTAVDPNNPMICRLRRLAIACFRLTVLQKTIPDALHGIWNLMVLLYKSTQNSKLWRLLGISNTP